MFSLLLFAVAAIFWRLGENERLRSLDAGPASPAPALPGATTPAVNPAVSAVKSAPAVPAVQPAPAPEKPKAKGPSEKKLYPYRLSNTSRGLQQLVRSDTALLLNNALIDTRTGKPVPVPAHLRAEGEPGGYIVQARGLIDGAFLNQLQRVGAAIVSYLPNNAYLVKLSAEGARRLEDMGRVQSVLPWEPYYKLDGALLKYAVEEKPLPAGAPLRLTLLPGEQASAVAALEKIGAEVLGADRSPFGPQLIVRPPLNALAALARLPAVQGVEPYLQRVPLNDLARVRVGVSSNSLAATPNWLNLTGTNVLVAVIDTPVDPFHPDLTNRIFTGAGTGITDPWGHGTFVAGIIGSSGANSPPSANVIGSASGANYRGMAPAVNLLSLDFGINGSYAGTAPTLSLERGFDGIGGSRTIGDALVQEYAARSNIFIFRRTNSTLIANNSWGYDSSFFGDIANRNLYNSSAASYDAAVRDAIPGLAGAQPVAYVFAAGNSGLGGDSGQGGIADTITSPATAKNVISVGAIENERDSVPGTDPGKERGVTNDIIRTNFLAGTTNVSVTTNAEWRPLTDTSNEVYSGSSRGNVGVLQEGAYGRFKPDLVAPGTFPVSTRSTSWDEIGYYNPLSVSYENFTNLTISPGRTNSFAVFVFDNTTNLAINLLNLTPPLNLLIYTNLNQAPPPSASAGNLAGPNSMSVAVGTNLANNNFYYDIVNTNTVPIRFDILTTQIRTNNYGNYFLVLSNLNGGSPPKPVTQLAPYYRYEVAGTSFSAPVISGMLALMQEFFEQILPVGLRRTNSPAMMKALLINGARSVSANYGLQVTNFLNLQGWGLPYMQTVIPEILSTENDPTKWPVQFFDQSATNAITTGERHTRNLTVNASGLDFPLRVTLVWTDPPGNPNAAVKLVNDLNLIVSNNVPGGQVYYGNAFPGGGDFSSPNGVTNVTLNATNVFNSAADLVNNVENVYINAPLTNSYTIIVEGYRVNVNAVPERTNSIAQDYALVISSGKSLVSGAFTVDQTPTKTTNTTPNVTFLSGATNQVLMNQRVGANAPLLTSTNGATNQWTFYVITNAGAGTNGIFATFLPPNAARPRNQSADLDLYVATDSNLTNLGAAAISNCFRGIAGHGVSTNRGGSEFVKFTNNTAGATYYVGIKSEDQQAAEFGFFAAFTDNQLGQQNADGSVDVFPIFLPAAGMDIPDGSPDAPGMTNVLAFNEFPITIRRAIVTNALTHENFGDLMTILSHEGVESILQNHGFPIGLPPNTGGSVTIVFDDSDENDIFGSQPSEGVPNLQLFAGQEGLGLWILTGADNQLNHTGRIDDLVIHLDPSSTNNQSGGVSGGTGSTNRVAAGSTFQDVVIVPPEAVSLTISVTIPLAQPSPGALELFVRRGAFPDLTPPPVADHFALISPPGGYLTITRASTPPLSPGTYYVSVRNTNAFDVEFSIRYDFLLDLAATAPLTLVNTNTTLVLDNGMTNSWSSRIPVSFSFTSLVTNKALSVNVATLTTDGPHNFVAGNTVQITGVDATFNGSYSVLAVPTPNTFTYIKVAANVVSTVVSPAGLATLNNASREVAGVRVGVRIDHPRPADLSLRLVAPSGKRVLFAENRGNLSTNGYGMGTNLNELAFASFSEDPNLAPKPIKYATEPAFLDFITPVLEATNYMGDLPLTITNSSSGGTGAASVETITVPTVGTISIDWMFYDAPDRMQVYNVVAGVTNLLWDSGCTNNASTASPFAAYTFANTAINVGPNTINIPAHGYATDQKVAFRAVSAPLDWGVSQGQIYYIRAAGGPNRISVTADPPTATPRVTTDLTAPIVTPGTYRVYPWFTTNLAFSPGTLLIVMNNPGCGGGTLWNYYYTLSIAGTTNYYNQSASSAIIQDGSLYLAGRTAGRDGNGIVARYGLPVHTNSVPIYSFTWPDARGGSAFYGLAGASQGTNGIFAVGSSSAVTIDPQSVPGEPKGVVAMFPLTTPQYNTNAPYGSVWYSQAPPSNSFPGAFPDAGLEELLAVTVKNESGANFVYATGYGQTNIAGGNPGRLMLVKLDTATGVVQWATNDAVSGLTNFSSGRAIGSYGTNIFVAGVTNDNVNLVTYLAAYDENGSNIWSRSGVNGQYNGLTVYNGEIYAVGARSGATTNFLIEKYTASGAQLWTTNYALRGEDILNGVLAFGDRLYAVGSTRAAAAGSDVAILEIDQATGALITRAGYSGSTTFDA